MRIAMLVFTALAFWGAAMPSHAERSPEELLQQSADVIIDVLQKERVALAQDPNRVRELMDRIVFSHVDMPRIAQLALGRYWRKATPEQRRQFTSEFKQLLQRSYTTVIQTYIDEIAEQAAQVKIHYQPTRYDPDTGEALVRTIIETPRGNSYSVDYRMHQLDGEWKIYDIVIEGVSLLTNFRTSFASEARHLGVEGLIAKLAQRNRQGDVAPVKPVE